MTRSRSRAASATAPASSPPPPPGRGRRARSDERFRDRIASPPPVRSELLDSLPEPGPGERAEDRLVELGRCTEHELGLEIALACGRRFTGLRDFVPDQRLFHYVPLAIAEREALVPMVLVGDTLTLACAYYDPDLSLVRRRFPKLDLDLVVATRSEITGALERSTDRA